VGILGIEEEGTVSTFIYGTEGWMDATICQREEMGMAFSHGSHSQEIANLQIH
jgi:hypothetical protein